ncbi:MAG: adventurous gliding motility lipoprotein CglB [Myxococcaceae bacterium]
MLRNPVLLLAVLSSLLLSCENPPCGPASCLGCCDPSGVCRACSTPAVQCLPSTCADCGGCDKPTPNLMLVLDKSGSMSFAADPTVAGCETCGDMLCPASCPRTRMADLRKAMSAFLTGPAASLARVGLLPFPLNSICGTASAAPSFLPSGVELNPTAAASTAELQAVATEVNGRIQTIVPFGGTPTGPTLRALASYPPLLGSDRDQFILLITDGEPNCNGAVDPATCFCTTPALAHACASGGLNQCLDRDGTIAAITELRDKGVRTFVVGFGAEAGAGTTAAEVLTAMALAGGLDRRCPGGTDAECDGAPGSCLQATKTCSTAYYRAKDGAGLTAALARITACLTP